MTADNITATSISLSWTSAGSEGVSYVVTWQTDDVGGCSGGNDTGSTTITDGSTSYDITELEEDSSYMITVTASNSAGSSAVSNTLTAMTMEAGERAIFSGHVILKCMTIPLAPSGAPSSVSVSEVASSNITLQWGLVPCIEQNGNITGYTVCVAGTGEMKINVSDDVGQVTISGLAPSTTYSIKVAAVTSIGTGPYSDPITFDTPDSK